MSQSRSHRGHGVGHRGARTHARGVASSCLVLLALHLCPVQGGSTLLQQMRKLRFGQNFQSRVLLLDKRRPREAPPEAVLRCVAQL